MIEGKEKKKQKNKKKKRKPEKVGRPKAGEKTRRGPSENRRTIPKETTIAGRERDRQKPNATKGAEGRQERSGEREAVEKNNKRLRRLLYYKAQLMTRKQRVINSRATKTESFVLLYAN